MSRRMRPGRRLVASALTLALAPGAGHLLFGRWLRGWLWFALALVGLLLAPFSSFGFWGLVLLARIPAIADIWLLRVEPPAPDDAPELAAARALESPRGRWSRGIGIAAGMALCIAVLGGYRRFYAEAFRVPTSGMVPTLMQGDHILATKFGLDPERGDVVVFWFPCEPRKAFVKRVVAVGGDTVEVRCTRLWVNGEPVARELVDDARSYVDFDEHAGIAQERDYAAYRETVGDRSYVIALEPGSDEAPGDRDFPSRGLPACHIDGEPAGGAIEASPPVPGVTGACAPQQRYRVPEGHLFVMGDNRANSADSRVWGPVPVEAVFGEARRIWYSQSPDDVTRWERLGPIR